MPWWKQHKECQPESSENIILFNRLMEWGVTLEKAAERVGWTEKNATEIKRLIWGYRTTAEISSFCLRHKLYHKGNLV